ncbi:MAG: hypothetical protein ABSH32_17785 [Bryobacteraceae bacterium]|jgi:arylsulfatase A-like enzyme
MYPGTNPNRANETYPGLAQYPALANNTGIVFTSDHGDYGGSHGLHAKGGGLDEEVMNVPLFVSYPSMRTAHPGARHLRSIRAVPTEHRVAEPDAHAAGGRDHPGGVPELHRLPAMRRQYHGEQWHTLKL